MKRAIFLILILCSMASAANYYVNKNGTGTGDGSIGSPWKNISEITGLSSGDTVYFHRGDKWTEKLTVPASGVTFGAYGAGAKPRLTNSLANPDWMALSANIWAVPSSIEVGNIIFNDGQSVACRELDEADLDNVDEFFWDDANDLVKLYSTSNPSVRYSQIDCARDYVVRIVNKSNLVFEGLDFRYSGRDIISSWGTCENVVIRYCDFSYGGGSLSYNKNRFGNGINIWSGAKNWEVAWCSFDQIFDTAVSPQGVEDSTIEDIYIHHNVITNCEMSYELFLRKNNTAAYLTNIRFENNSCLNAGSSWGHNQRNSPVQGHHVSLQWTIAEVSGCTIKNNIFYESTESAIYAHRSWLRGPSNGLEIDNNCYYESSGYVADWNDVKYESFSAYQAASGKDEGSLFTELNFGGEESLAMTLSIPVKDRMKILGTFESLTGKKLAVILWDSDSDITASQHYQVQPKLTNETDLQFIRRSVKQHILNLLRTADMERDMKRERLERSVIRPAEANVPDAAIQ